jgi:MscS family membrane protein
VLENFFGGLMLLLSEPFVAGDMVTFRHGSELIEGRVERIGWYQTRLRGRDTRPTYVPNNVFVQNMATNIDRVTNRLFEHEFYVSYEDASRLPGALNDAKAALKQLPKVDQLSPLRMYLVGYSDRGLKVKTVLYFATRGLDEFLHLQQVRRARQAHGTGVPWFLTSTTPSLSPSLPQLALLEITRVLGDLSCSLAHWLI